MIVRHLQKVHGLLTVLTEPTAEMRVLRTLLMEKGRYPTRRTWERRLKAIPATLPAQIGCLGRHLVILLQPWAASGRAVAIDSTPLRTHGGVWHQKDREQGIVPHSAIDTEAHWTKSGWHGWVYGWRLHLVTTVAAIWIPLAAQLTAANVADNEPAPGLLRERPADARFLLRDRHYNRANVRQVCQEVGLILVASHYGRHPHTDAGVAVRRIFQRPRTSTIENFNEQFKGIFGSHSQVQTKGLVNTQRFALAAVFVYQLALLYRVENGLDLRIGLKPFLKVA